MRAFITMAAGMLPLDAAPAYVVRGPRIISGATCQADSSSATPAHDTFNEVLERPWQSRVGDVQPIDPGRHPFFQLIGKLLRLR
jgi:hypothetical protein